MLVPTTVQPNTEDTEPINDSLKSIRYKNRPGALHYNKRGEIEQMDEADEVAKTSVLERNSVKTNPKTDVKQSEAINPTFDEKNTNSKDEIIKGKYTFIEEDGLPATIEYEAGPEIGFVVKSVTKESLQSRLLEKGPGTCKMILILLQ